MASNITDAWPCSPGASASECIPIARVVSYHKWYFLSMSLLDHTSVRDAREDRGWTQRALAEAAGLKQANIAAIESGARPASPALLRRILAAADYRPSLPLAQNADAINQQADALGIDDVRVFGSVARGTDHHGSDIDLLVRLRPGVAGFELGAFKDFVERVTGFPVDVVVDHGDTESLEHIRLAARPLA